MCVNGRLVGIAGVFIQNGAIPTCGQAASAAPASEPEAQKGTSETVRLHAPQPKRRQ